MSEIHTFTTLDKDFTLTVKGEFLKNCPEPDKVKLVDLLTTHRATQYFHNPTGPAIIRHTDNHQEYWIDGRKVNDEEAKRISHTHKFNGKLMDIVNEE